MKIKGMINNELKNIVSFVQTDKEYPNFPYEKNSNLYNALLELLEKFGLPKENPFLNYIKPGQTALIKPNWVRDRNPLGHSLESLITHPSLIKYLIDLLALAMDGRGKIIIADAPLQNCNFENLKDITKIEAIILNAQKEYKDLEISIEDWRLTTLKSSDTNNKNVQEYREGDDKYEIIDLSNKSFLEEISFKAEKFRVTKYRPSLMQNHHKQGKHEYLITKRIFEADFFINLPKMKTHIKAGLTSAMKNLVGINGHKEFLPHHVKGSAEEGGDNYEKSSWFKRRYEDLYDYVWENVNNVPPNLRKILMRVLQLLLKISVVFGGDEITAGSWKGNDTIWRTTLDLNHIAYFQHEKPFKILNIVDGIIAGEGEGPLEPTPRAVGILIAGENPACVDATIAKLMGYEISEISTIQNALTHLNSKFACEFIPDSKIPNFNFKKPKFWG